MTTVRQSTSSSGAARGAGSSKELSAAQRAAVGSDARLVVVQGGPGTGKTEAALARIVRLSTSLRQDAAWLLTLVTSERKAGAFRRRLARALGAAGCREAMIERTVAGVLPAAVVVGRDGDSADPAPAWPEETVRRASTAATQLEPALGLARHQGEATELLLDMMRIVSQKGAERGDAGSDGDWLRRGVALVEESVRFAQIEVVRHLRMLEGTPGWIGDLGRQLRRPADVTPRSRDLRSAVDRALRTAIGDRAALERLRGWVDLAGIDLAEAVRREAVAAAARRRLWEAALALSAELGVPSPEGNGNGGPSGPSLTGGVRHVVVDDAHDLSAEQMLRLRERVAPAALFVTGDQRAAVGRAESDEQFRALLREAGRAVVLLEAPRFGAGLGRFINALGSRLWPASEPGGYAPAVARFDGDRAASLPVELLLVRRRAERRPDGGDHPEPIADARRREAAAVAAGAKRVCGAGGDGHPAVLVQEGCDLGPVAAALDAAGMAGCVDLLTVDESQGLEWSTVLVTGLDDALGGPAPRRAWVDAASGLPVVWPEDDRGRRVWPFSSLLLAQRAAARRDALARRRLFLAAARARTRLVLVGITRDRAAGGESCVTPVEWLRRELGVAELAGAPPICRLGEASVGVRVVESAAAGDVTSITGPQDGAS